MSDTVDTLILDLLEWMGPNPRPYAELLEAWRTLVSVSAAGAVYLRKHRQPSPR